MIDSRNIELSTYLYIGYFQNKVTEMDIFVSNTFVVFHDDLENEVMSVLTSILLSVLASVLESALVSELANKLVSVPRS